ncbi:hypothetical protein LSTR_LSTR010422 [Laodelphax striatellus]|uniref:Lipase domain-containing protein n=1 Tax=Laodelphax striatellus TaxID=195883 RepID=A0A482XH24_LAOST|nr:hypothetical protein LSTR_LSTR010422 [Laodelphax striatellus]
MMFSRNYCSTYSSISFLFVAANAAFSDSSSCPVVSSADEICAPESQQVNFYLFTRKTANSPFEINYNNIEEAPFLPSAPLKIMIHGYTGWKDYSPNMELRPAYFKKSDYNLLSIDWSILGKEGCYVEATRNVKPVGQCVARMLEKIVYVRREMKPEDVHVIGFSLGAHVAGFVGKSLVQFKAKRITGLDPALPLFDDLFNSGSSLSKEDAEFVDVIHSNGGMKGKSFDVGHIDFYANGGSLQPGCATTNTSCHHVRAVEIFAESIYSESGFYGFECSSLMHYMSTCCGETPNTERGRGWVRLGEYVDNTSRGSYYFDTSDKHPLALGKACVP